jgi:isoleucyl-tRNA synthetase
LQIPEVKEKLLNESITDQMGNVISIIETARKLREAKQLSLKYPISSLTIVNKDKAFLDEIYPFLPYINQEINVKDIKLETNTDQYIKFEALPNLPVLGPKFKGNKAFSSIRNGITQLSSAEIAEAKQKGYLDVANHRIELVYNEL